MSISAGACSTFGILHATKLLPLVGRGGWSPPPVPAESSLNCWISGPFLFVAISACEWQGAKPSTPNTMTLFLHGCHNLRFRRDHVADVFFDYSGKPSPKPTSSLTLFSVLSTWWSYSTFWNLIWTPFDNIGCSTSFSRSTTRGSTLGLIV